MDEGGDGRNEDVAKGETNGRNTPDPEVPEKARRRRFTGEYKLDILQRADACEEGQLGELLRREGLYSSHLVTWRRQRDEGALGALQPKKRGRKARPRDPITIEAERLRRENAQLQRRLEQAEIIIEVQKKVATLLGVKLPTDGENETNE